MSTDRWDVVVVGGGTAGVTAGIASARSGAKTLIIERYGFPGGVATHGIPFLAFIAGDGSRVVDGIPQELVNRMMELEGSPGHCRGASWRTGGDKSYEFAVTPYETEIYKYAALEMLSGAGADLMMHTVFSDVILQGGIIKGIELLNKDGRRRIESKVFVDATGDGDLFALAGFPYRKGDLSGKMQNVSLLFNLGGVDTEKMVNALKESKGFSGWDKWHTRIIKGRKLGSGLPGYIHMAGHVHPWRDERYLTFTAVSAREGNVSFNITRTTGVDGTAAGELTLAELSERKNMIDLIHALRKNILGFEKMFIISTAPQIGVRETRNITGEYVMTREDVVGCREFPDNIARGCYPIDIHDPLGGKTKFEFLKDGGSYGIPYRALVPKGSKNLLTAGRCISTTHEAHGTVRIMSTAMAVGQAAGTAAAMIAKNDHGCCMDMDVSILREKLKLDRAVLDKKDVIYE